LISDVPLGVFLSGGIDSSTVVALMSEICDEPIKTFSIGFAEHEYNELEYARLVARRFRTDHHELIVEPCRVDILPQIAKHFGEPFADASALPTYFVSKMARQHVKVALSGDGGDELFLGYTGFRGLELARYVQLLPTPIRKAIAVLLTLLPRTARSAWNYQIEIVEKRIADSLLPPDEAYRSKSTVTGLATVWPVLSRDLQERLSGRNPYVAIDECLTRYSSANGVHPLERFIYAGLKVSLPGDILVKTDRMSMANSLEVRVPLLDHVLAEFVATIPIKQRFPKWRLKGLLRDTMADTLPTEIINLPKHGFTIPLAAWFRGDLAIFASDVLLSAKARQHGCWNSVAVEDLLRQHVQGSRSVAQLVWGMLMFELWYQHVCD
jgi:asparagine synthase (glutamine-hydrolysing)